MNMKNCMYGQTLSVNFGIPLVATNSVATNEIRLDRSEFLIRTMGYGTPHGRLVCLYLVEKEAIPEGFLLSSEAGPLAANKTACGRPQAVA